MNFIPGRLILGPGARADYKALERFHYVAGPPATWAQIWTIFHLSKDEWTGIRCKCPIAIAVLSYPCLNCDARKGALNLNRLSAKKRQRFINGHIRTISRLIVHPAYRGLGLASILVKCILNNCPTRYIEALAAMAKGHPLFSRSGMREFRPLHPDKPTYYLAKKRRIISEDSRQP